MPLSESAVAMNRVGRYFASLIFSASIALHVTGESQAQDNCGLGEQVVELLSTVDACFATSEQLDELESVRQEVLAPYDDIDCAALRERIALLASMLPRRSGRWPTTLEQPVPMCEASWKAPFVINDRS